MSVCETVRNKYRSLNMVSVSRDLESILNSAEQNEISYLQFAEMLSDHELSSRHQKKVAYNLKRSAFPVIKRLDEFNFTFQTTITKKQVSSLLDFSFIDNRENIVFIGPPGVGKTHLATSIAVKAVEAGYKALFVTALNLIESLDLAELRGELKQKIASMLKFDVLLIDELGYLPLNKKSAHNLFQLVNTMYEFRSIILTTNKDFTQWTDFFFDDNVAVPIVDRIIHHSHIFMLGGDSFRLKEKINRL